MRRLLLIFFVVCTVASAQTTNVTGNITDSDGVAWANSNLTFSLYNPTSSIAPTCNGTPMTQAQTKVLTTSDAFGNFSTSVCSTSSIVPAQSLWTLSICSNTTAPCQILQPMQMNGGSLNLTPNITSTITAIRLPASPTTRAYADVEIQPTPPSGGTYFNVTSNTTRQWNGSAWINQGTGSLFNNLGDTIYGGAGGAPTILSGPIVGTVPYIFCSTPSGGVAQAPAWCLAGIGGRTVASGPDTILATDRGQSITYTSASAVAVTLPSAASFGNNFDFIVLNLGAGTVTITPSGGTINGNANVTVAASANCGINSQDNTNYVARCGTPGGVAGVASFNTRTGIVSPAAADYTAAQVTNAFDLSNAGTQTSLGILAFPATGTASATNVNFGTAGTGIYGSSTNVQIAVSAGLRGSFTSNGLHMGTNKVSFGSNATTDDAQIVRNTTGILQLNGSSGAVNATFQLGLEESAVGTAITSAATIAPTTNIVHITGTTPIATITAPAGTTSTVGVCVIFITDAAAVFTSGGNIAATGQFTATAGQMYRGCYDGTSWYIK